MSVLGDAYGELRGSGASHERAVSALTGRFGLDRVTVVRALAMLGLLPADARAVSAKGGVTKRAHLEAQLRAAQRESEKRVGSEACDGPPTGVLAGAAESNQRGKDTP